MRAVRTKSILAAGVLVAITGCGLVAGFGDVPSLGNIEGGDGGLVVGNDGAPLPGSDGGPSASDAGKDSAVAPLEDGGCPSGSTACPSGCTNTATDPSNCGACGHTCGKGFSCSGNVCADAVVQMSAGGTHVCAALANGAVYCWGDNARGQVGTGDAGGTYAVPVAIPRDDHQATIASPTQLASGLAQSCALFTGGIMKCWGDDTLGQLGNGHFSDGSDDAGLTYPLPDQAYQSLGTIPELTAYSYTSLAAGSTADHGCATTTADASVLCWGDNHDGQLWSDAGATDRIQHCGAGAVTECAPAPGMIGTLQNVTQLAVGEVHTCAIDSSGAAYCWGSPHYGQVGDGNQGVAVNVDAVPVLLDAGVTQIAAGEFSTCAVTTDAAVWCWGYNDYGTLGHDAGLGNDTNCSVRLGSTQWCSGSPTPVAGLGPASKVAAGCNHTCALLEDGTVWCWGDNSDGQLGTGDNVPAGYPRKVSGLASVQGISLGCDTSCAWTTDGTAWCWGQNAEGELANGTPTNASSPTRVMLP